MKSPYETLADAISSRPYIVAGVVVAVLIVALFGSTLVSMKTGSDTYMDKTKPAGVLLDKYTNTFSSDAIILIVESDNILDPDVLSYMDRIESDIAVQQYITSVSGLPDYLKAMNGGDLPSSIAAVKNTFNQIPADQQKYLLPSGMMTLVTITLEPGLPDGKNYQVLTQLDSLIATSQPPPGVEIIVSGNPAFEQEMQNMMGPEMGSLIGLAMLLMIVAMLFLFRYVRYSLLPVAIVGCGIITTFGIMGLAHIPISMIVIAAFPVMIGIGIDYAIQFQSRFDDEVRKSSIPEAVFTTVTRSGPAILFAMVSTALGFLALAISPLPMVGDFGLICIVGVSSCYLSALIIVPTFATLVQYTPKSPKKRGESSKTANGSITDHYNHLLGLTATKVARHAVIILVVLFVIACIGLQLDNKVPINTDEDTFVPPGMPAKIDMDKVTRTLGSMDTLPVYVRTAGVMDIKTLEWMAGFGDYLKNKHYEVSGVTSIATIIADVNGGKIPSSQVEVDEILATIPEKTKSAYLYGNLEAVVKINTIEMTIPHAESLLNVIRDDLVWYGQPPGMESQMTGMSVMFADLIKDIKDSKNPMTFLGFGLIGAFLLVLYRKISAIGPIIPIMMIVGWNGAIMYLLKIDYNPMTACLGAMTIGVASEYTILIMERYEEERERGMDLYSAIETAIQKIGMAITISGCTTVFGFSALTLATFPILANFGLVTVITVAFSVIGAIMVMPAVIVCMDRISHHAKAGCPSSNGRYTFWKKIFENRKILNISAILHEGETK